MRQQSTTRVARASTIPPLEVVLADRIVERSKAAADHGGDIAKEELAGVRRMARRLARRPMSAEAETIHLNVIGRLILGALTDVDEQGRNLLDKVAADTIKLGGLLRVATRARQRRGVAVCRSRMAPVHHFGRGHRRAL